MGVALRRTGDTQAADGYETEPILSRRERAGALGRHWGSDLLLVRRRGGFVANAAACLLLAVRGRSCAWG